MASGESTHVVRRGETLSQIASSASGSSANSSQARNWMLAIFQANPRAFEQNMNLMRSGAVLRMPDYANDLAARGKLDRRYHVVGKHGGAWIYDVDSHEEFERLLARSPVFNFAHYDVRVLAEMTN